MKAPLNVLFRLEGMQWLRPEPRHAVTGLSPMIVLKRGYQAPDPSISRSEHEHHPPRSPQGDAVLPGLWPREPGRRRLAVPRARGRCRLRVSRLSHAGDGPPARTRHAALLSGSEAEDLVFRPLYRERPAFPETSVRPAWTSAMRSRTSHPPTRGPNTSLVGDQSTPLRKVSRSSATPSGGTSSSARRGSRPAPLYCRTQARPPLGGKIGRQRACRSWSPE